MLYNWQKMSGKLSLEEEMLIGHICKNGLRETRTLLKERGDRAETKGAILAFETIQNANFRTIENFLEQYQSLDTKCRELRITDITNEISKYWKLRGQQIQFEFILDRIMALRVITGQMESPVSIRAIIYVGQWLVNKLGES